MYLRDRHFFWLSAVTRFDSIHAAVHDGCVKIAGHHRPFTSLVASTAQSDTSGGNKQIDVFFP